MYGGARAKMTMMDIASACWRITVLCGFSGNNDLRIFLFPGRYCPFFKFDQDRPIKAVIMTKERTRQMQRQLTTEMVGDILSLLTGLAEL